MLVGFPGTAPTAESRAIVSEGVGGLILYANNIVSGPQVRDLISSLQAVADLPMEVAVDEEPGRIARLTGIVPDAPSARDLGKGPADEIQNRAETIGRSLRSLGVTTDFAPVLDVTSASATSVIGDRSFGDDPATVTQAGIAFAHGLQAAGIQAVGKHFPGHGETTIDSHAALPVVSVSRERLVTRDVEPFKGAVASGLPYVMVAHLIVQVLDPTLPTSLSAAALALLRDTGFSGVAVTDALEMEAIAGRWDLPTAAEMALAAGEDQLLIYRDYERLPEILDRLEAAASAGRVPVSRIREAFLRVEAAKHVTTWSTCL